MLLAWTPDDVSHVCVLICVQAAWLMDICMQA